VGDDPWPLDPDGLQGDPAVVDQDPVTGPDVCGQTLVGRRGDVGVAVDVLGGDGELAARLEQDGPAREGTQADLGALQVDQHTHAMPAVIGGGPDQPIDLLVVAVGAVAEVEPRDIHAGVNERAHSLRALCRRPERADDLGSAHKARSSRQALANAAECRVVRCRQDQWDGRRG
jgi:hypothetical protein